MMHCHRCRGLFNRWCVKQCEKMVTIFSVLNMNPCRSERGFSCSSIACWYFATSNLRGY
jgi:hypothetical protein